MKKYLNRLFIDGLSGMAYGLFATLIIGTIQTQNSCNFSLNFYSFFARKCHYTNFGHKFGNFQHDKLI